MMPRGLFAFLVVVGLSGQDWTQTSKVTASDRAVDAYFGQAVCIDGDYAIVGAPTYSGAGSAYIYHYNGSSWDFVQKLAPGDLASGDNFGSSVSISGDYAIVSAPHQTLWKGSVYIFLNSGGTWSQVQKITASDGASNYQFGYSVSVSNNYAVIGTHPQVARNGVAYIFENDGGTWSQAYKALASDGATSDRFGYSVSISGDYALIGAYEEDHDASGGNQITSAGSAYLFYRSGGTWSQIQKLVASDRATDDNFGKAVSISGNNLVVGAYREDHDDTGASYIWNTGSVYVFKNNSGYWTESQKLIASDRAYGDYFGSAVSISGDHIVIGADSEDEDASGANTQSSAGSAYIFVNDAGTWSQDQKVVASDRAANDHFGFADAVSGSHALIGANYEDQDASGGSTKNASGSAYLYYAAPDVSLPVSLTEFRAEVHEQYVEIIWVTDSEVENLGFILERRIVGRLSHFENLSATDPAERQPEFVEGWSQIVSYQSHSELEGAGSSNLRAMYAFTDHNIDTGLIYEYRLADVSYTGDVVYHAMTLTGVMIAARPASFTLIQNYPNPFNPVTTITYTLPEKSHVSLLILDINGREVITLGRDIQAAGYHEIVWNGLDHSGSRVASGIYYCVMQTPMGQQTVKMMLLK